MVVTISMDEVTTPVKSPLYPIGISAEERFWRWVDRRAEEDCWDWLGATSRGGYGSFGIRHGVQVSAHRVAWELINGPIPDGMMVRHFVCDNRLCVNPDHLRLGSHQENMDDRTRKGRNRPPKGEGQKSAKLTDDTVRRMRHEYRDNQVSAKALAKRHGVSTQTAWKAITGRTWKHV